MLDDAWHYDLYFSLSVPGVVSVIGNGLVLLVYGQRRKKLRVHELMTINLAVCDFGYSLLGAPCLIISRYSTTAALTAAALDSTFTQRDS